MKEKLQEYALLAEIISAVGIIISLVFVGFQIRDNTVASQAATYQASVGYDIELLMHLSADPDLSRIIDIYTYGDDASSLSANDIVRAQYEFTALLRHLENLYLQHELGMLSDESWTTRQAFMEATLTSPGYARFQSAPTARNFSGAFLDYANTLRARAG